MPVPNCIHILGASGSGTTTLGRVIARQHGHRHLDTDDFFWLPTDPPYQQPRPRLERLELLRRALDIPRWVLSGSLCGWGDELIPRFGLVVFLTVPPALRLERLQQRERDRFGAAIDSGGVHYEQHLAFMTWAASYDKAHPSSRSRAGHDAWLAELPCPVIRIDNAGPMTDLSRLLPK